MTYQTAKQEKPRNGTSLGVKHFKSAEEKAKTDDAANSDTNLCALKLLLA